MSKRTENIRLMISPQEIQDLESWLVENGLARYPRSSAMRLFQRMVMRSGLKPTGDEIQAADVSKVEKTKS